MSGLMSRGLVLTVSRVSNFGLLMLSPLLLVRLLDVETYGSYQEFMIYATLLVTVGSFGIDSSLTYFLPRHPDDQKQIVSQNSFLILILSTCLAVLVLVFKDAALQIVSYDFIFPLAAYVFFFVNLNWLEYYWIARQRTDLVLVYSAARLLVRIGVLLLVAYLTRDISAIVWSLVAVEAFRVAVVAIALLRFRLLELPRRLERTLEQVRFAGPIGLAALMQQGSRHIGKLFVGSILGPAALAYYAVASYILPLVLVIRGSIADVVFPELVRSKDDPSGVLRLWRRSNIVFCILLFPPFVLLTWYAELFVTTLFTTAYQPAVPVFHIYVLWLLRRCFNTDVLLRTRGRTGFMFTGTGLAVLANLVLMIILYRWLGLVGPALAFIASEVLLEAYNSRLVRQTYGLTLRELADWGQVARIAAGCIIGLPVLLVGELLPGPDLVIAIACSTLYLTASLGTAYALGVSDVGHLTRFAVSLVYGRFRRV